MDEKYKVYTSEADAIADRAHITKLAVAAGRKYPQTPDMLKRGKRCGPDKIPDEKLLAQWATNYYPHPDPKTKAWMMVVNGFIAECDGHLDLTTAHKIDLKDAVTELPETWTATAVAMGGELPR
jgi:hypothetical protein